MLSLRDAVSCRNFRGLKATAKVNCRSTASDLWPEGLGQTQLLLCRLNATAKIRPPLPRLVNSSVTGDPLLDDENTHTAGVDWRGE